MKLFKEAKKKFDKGYIQWLIMNGYSSSQIVELFENELDSEEKVKELISCIDLAICNFDNFRY